MRMPPPSRSRPSTPSPGRRRAAAARPRRASDRRSAWRGCCAALRPAPTGAAGSASRPSLGMRGLPCMCGNGGLEALAALDVIAEHVEARARRRQQHGIAGLARAIARATAPRARARLHDRRCAGSAARSPAHRGRAAPPRGNAPRPPAFSGAKSCPLPSPPAMSTTGRPMPSSAASVAATVVPLESLTNSTSAMSATRSIRCGKPWNAASAASSRVDLGHRRGERQGGERVQRVVPPDERELVGRRSAARRRARATARPGRSTSPHSCSPSGTPAPKVCTRDPAAPSPASAASSRLRICAPPARRCAPWRRRSRPRRRSDRGGFRVTLSTVAATA